jgi:L-alanine-DL-glutamate epimerase-like enolase superfamily enzyme
MESAPEKINHMKITNLTSTILSVPFIMETLWPYGRWAGVTLVVVEIETDAGIVGIGESQCLVGPAEATRMLLNSVEPLLRGEDPFNIERIGKKIAGIGGWGWCPHFAGYALSGIDMALWDIMGKACGQPVYKLLGGKIRDKVKCFKYIHHGKPGVMAAEAGEAVSQGYDTIYCKYTGIAHLKDAIEAIRGTIGDEPTLWVDFNQTLSPGFAIQFLQEMSEYRIDIVEQPVLASNLDAMAYVKNATSSRVLAHESSWTPHDTLNLIKRDAADILSIDIRMSWGIVAAKKAAAVAEAAGMPVLLHSSADLGVSQAAQLHLAASTPNCILANQCLYDWFEDDYIQGGKLQFEGDCLPVPTGPGFGITLDREKLRQYHEHYKEVGTYLFFSVSPGELRTAPVPLFPTY